MARIIEYADVLNTLTGQGLRSLYYNSGSFGFPPGDAVRHLGWTGPPDDTIRAEARPFTRQVPAPYDQTLAGLATRVWQAHLPGVAWAMPKSHWAYELDFGSREWMPGALHRLGLDPGSLAPRTDGSAIEFATGEAESFRAFLETLLAHLSGSSDFQLAWPGRPVVCTVHHHQQLWWSTADAGFLTALQHVVR